MATTAPSATTMKAAEGRASQVARAASSFARRFAFRATMTRRVFSCSAGVISGQFVIRDVVPSVLMTMGPSSSIATASPPTATL